MAFSRFDHIAAPTPPRPSARVPSFMMEEIKTSFSPAGPMQATLRPTPPSAAVDAGTSNPQ